MIAGYGCSYSGLGLWVDNKEVELNEPVLASGTMVITCMDCGRIGGWFTSDVDFVKDELVMDRFRKKGWTCEPGIEVRCPRCRRKMSRETKGVTPDDDLVDYDDSRSSVSVDDRKQYK
jgi:hypothetical protein